MWDRKRSKYSSNIWENFVISPTKWNTRHSKTEAALLTKIFNWALMTLSYLFFGTWNPHSNEKMFIHVSLLRKQLNSNALGVWTVPFYDACVILPSELVESIFDAWTQKGIKCK